MNSYLRMETQGSLDKIARLAGYLLIEVLQMPIKNGLRIIRGEKENVRGFKPGIDWFRERTGCRR